MQLKGRHNMSITIERSERHYIPCPHLKCKGLKDTEVCYRKCTYYKNGKCETIKKIYREEDHGNKRGKENNRSS